MSYIPFNRIGRGGMKEEWDFPAALGTSIVLVIFVCLAFSITGVWHWVAEVQGTTWAAWVQAVGSIGAIGVAIYLGRRTERQNAAGSLAHAFAFRACFKDGLTGAIYGCRVSNKVVIDEGLAVLTDAIELGRSVRMDRLTDKEVLKLAQIRTHAALAESLLRKFVNAPNNMQIDFVAVRMRLESIQNAMLIVDGKGPHNTSSD